MLSVKEIGLYESIETDEQGLPIRGTPVTKLSRLVKGEDIKAVLYLRIAGDAGTYPLTVDVETPHPDYRASPLGSDIEVPADGDCHLIIDLPFPNPPPGSYLLIVKAGSIELAKLTFEIER